VNLSSVNYHFGSKENLFRELLKRRMAPINKTRMESLEQIKDAAEKSGSLPQLRDILKAFFDPALELMEKNESSRPFVAILGSALHHPDVKIKKIFIHIMRPVAIPYFDCICRALPELDKEIVLTRVQLALGVFYHGVSMLYYPDGQPDGILSSVRDIMPGPRKYNQEIIDFMVKGIKGK